LASSTTTTSTAAAAIRATAGLATQIVLGFVTANKGGSLSQRDFALVHQIVGYSTFGATAVGFGVLLF